MTTKAMQELDEALKDVRALLTQAHTYSGGKKGAPKGTPMSSRPARPFTRAATVMLAGAAEAFLESLAIEAADHLGLQQHQKKEIKEAADRLHGVGADGVNRLYAMLGMPFITDSLGWPGLPKGSVRYRLDQLRTARNKIAHGRAPKNARIVDADHLMTFVGSLAKALEEATAARISESTGTRFTW